jgi:SAM-dependent methyltransferase
MSLKEVLKRMILLAMRIPFWGRAIIDHYERRPLLNGWNREHPYDLIHCVNTSGTVPGFVLAPGASAYAAAQPSIIRGALAAIPQPQHCHFLDLGCGKGRPLLIATEFGFPAITGVECSPTLSSIARRNSAIFARTYPDRPRIEIVTGDAPAYKLPEQNLVVFLYNPFGRPRMVQLLSSIETSLRTTPRELYIVYYNPAWAEVLDASSALERRYAAQLPYHPSEIGYGPDESDSVVVWQNRGNRHRLPHRQPRHVAGLRCSHILLVNRLTCRFSDAVLKGGSSWLSRLGHWAISAMHGEQRSART